MPDAPADNSADPSLVEVIAAALPRVPLCSKPKRRSQI